jgi:signal transduction histidine kinase
MVAQVPDRAAGGVRQQHRSRLDVRVVPHRRKSPLRISDWRMRTKLAAVLVIPSVAFMVLAGVQTAGLFGQASSLDQFAQQVGIGREISILVDELQQERDRTAGELAGLDGPAPRRVTADEAAVALRPHYDTVDAAVDRLRRAAAPLADADVAWRVSYARVDEALKQLPDVRAAVPSRAAAPNTLLGNYDRAIEALLTLLAEPSPGSQQPALTNSVLRYVQLARVKEIGSQIRRELYAAARAGQYGPDVLVKLADLRSQQFAALGEFRVAATAPQVLRYERMSADPGFVAATRMEETTIASTGETPAVLEPEAWWSTSQQRLRLLGEVEGSVLGDAVDEAQSRSAGQLRRTLLVAGAVLAVLLVALLTSVIIGRSIARSLRMLRGQALRVAQVELPDALERLRGIEPDPDIEVSPAVVRSMDEIGDVAEAFVAVQRSAVTLAVEQAVMRRNVNAMFVNLARRSQVLVERQLELLDDLEREESDPDQLDNLFRLDHLAARMRRNDDSLLVLAGSESSRRWNQPVPLAAVMLAAVAEVEQYQRVRHQVGDQLYVVGHAVADLVHLLAELLENGASFSPPDTVVRIQGSANGPDGAVIEIIDDGLGMSPTALAEANAVLATPPAADVAASQRMGLFVVSHLAARQGVRVVLRAAERGVLATVWLPAALLAEAPSQEQDHRPGRRMIAALESTSGFAFTAGQLSAGGGATDRSAAPAAPGEWPGAGSPRPRRTTTPRPVPTRAEDILAPAGDPAPPAASTWWSRQGRSAGTGSGAAGPDRRAIGGSGAGAGAAGPPPVPVTGGLNANGLPVRVPMAQLPDATLDRSPGVPVPRDAPDPDEVSGVLSRFYGGVRRAEAEDTTDLSTPAGGAMSDKEHQ